MSSSNDNRTDIERRKNEHIDICLREDVQSRAVRSDAHRGNSGHIDSSRSGFDSYRFRHNALPEIDFAAIDISASFLGRPLQAPLLVSSMTGGTTEANRINRRLAEAAERRGWAMALGSGRAAIERPELAESFRVRELAPTIPIVANLGAVQLNYGYGADECRRLIELTEADGLVLHLNGLQEVFQPEGDTDFSGLLRRIEKLCRELDKPIGAKEVGWGIDGENAGRLFDAGVSFVDVAGAGGTSWSQVEKFRLPPGVRREAAEALAGWGQPTPACIEEARSAVPDGCLIGSGGLASGVDAAKAIALGANLAGFGRSLLAEAVESVESIEEKLAVIEFELRAAMFGIGAGTLEQLAETNRLIRPGG
ncbi:type 2 isopentenyl-diphosphate Delta-isomerase [Cohnella lubricantis]|uniref:Isopentenyl-diphosphate delta-isomerase n=1 Tax=Cohnella lubricantis TaxID=2163172 RepID=A0A841TED1_9BACL|nr:type 2 isopentenyl-diphosphate Delta-isomerase [Cohnella lubricantis]MBB6679644.1 type 2 isopentenyl-diphosphate Delta-isomerase [Cohnella lubricantis]MBP2118582.1 isopentenyl-diphosphate delta-isomerase [Cohnella lubricantis]